jgi:hypothetical protein
MRSLSLRRILELTVESAKEILSSKSSEAAMDFLGWGSDRTMNIKRRAYAFLDFGFRETDDSGFLPAEGESATLWATCLRELIEEAARICIPFLPVGILAGSSESRRRRLIGDGPGRLGGPKSIEIVELKNKAGHTERQLSLALCLQGPGDMELVIENERQEMKRTLLPDFLGLLVFFLGLLVLDFIGDDAVDIDLALESESELRYA